MAGSFSSLDVFAIFLKVADKKYKQCLASFNGEVQRGRYVEYENCENFAIYIDHLALLIYHRPLEVLKRLPYATCWLKHSIEVKKRRSIWVYVDCLASSQQIFLGLCRAEKEFCRGQPKDFDRQDNDNITTLEAPKVKSIELSLIGFSLPARC